MPSSNVMSPTFVSAAQANQQIGGMLTQADAATNSGRFLVRQDFMEIIGDYLYRNCPMWSVLRKEPATAEIVKEIRYTSLPSVGFSNKRDLSTAPSQAPGNRFDLTDTGQIVKALTGVVDWSHFDRSLAAQQGNPYGDIVAKDTNDLIVAACKELEGALFTGNATDNPLEFNGLESLLPVDHVFTANYTGSTPDYIGQKLAEAITRISSNRRVMRKVTNIFCNGCGFNVLQKENEARRMILEKTEFLPGIQVPGILSNNGIIPIQLTPYIDNIDPVAEPSTPGKVVFWLLDMDLLVWKGVVPFMGVNTFDPQIFEVTQYISTTPLTEKRLMVAYGTLYGLNQGDGIWRLEVDVPDNMLWSQTA